MAWIPHMVDYQLHPLLKQTLSFERKAQMSFFFFSKLPYIIAPRNITFLRATLKRQLQSKEK